MSRRPVRYRGENRYDLYTIIFELSADRAFQRGRRLRGDSTGTEPDCGTTGMDHDDGVYESYHDRVNDAGTDCGQFSNLCRNSDSGTSGSGCGNLGMYFPILYHCIGIGIHISALSWRLCDGKYFRQSSPSGSGADRGCRTFDATGSSSSRGKWGEDDPVGQSGSFCGSFYSAPQMETEPNSCDVGLRRCQPGS